MRWNLRKKKSEKVLAVIQSIKYTLAMDITTDTPAWITELIAATGRFEALADQTVRNAEAFIADLKKDSENMKKILA